MLPLPLSEVNINVLLSSHLFCDFCRFRCVTDFLCRKINLSGISPAKRYRSGPNSVYVDWSSGDYFTEVWARSTHFGQNEVWGESREARVFLCGNPRDFSATHNGRFLPYLSAKHSSVSRRWIRKDIFKNFHFRGYLSQKTWNRKSVKQPPHSE